MHVGRQSSLQDVEAAAVRRKSRFPCPLMRNRQIQVLSTTKKPATGALDVELGGGAEEEAKEVIERGRTMKSTERWVA